MLQVRHGIVRALALVRERLLANVPLNIRSACMAHRWKNLLKDRDVTDHAQFLNRRQIMAGVAGLGLASALNSPHAAHAQ